MSLCPSNKAHRAEAIEAASFKKPAGVDSGHHPWKVPPSSSVSAGGGELGKEDGGLGCS